MVLKKRVHGKFYKLNARHNRRQRMFQIIRSHQRGQADHEWLKSFHTFSFANYYNEKMMGFSSLRVINEDWIEAQQGFPTHGHRDMEIITYIVEGALEHKDSMGNTAIIKPGEVQRMSAGTGVKHSEFNPINEGKTHLLQIWIMPNALGITPSYGQKDFSQALSKNDFVLVASEKGEDGSISLQQEMKLYASKRHHSGSFIFNSLSQKKYWVQLVKGELNLLANNTNEILKEGDAAVLTQTNQIKFTWENNVEMLIFELI